MTACSTFDYDCDGAETPRYTSAGVCEPEVCAIIEPGWYGTSVPACGEEGFFTSECETEFIDLGGFGGSFYICLPADGETRMQECR